jgi:hypothetical protein
MTQFYSFWLHNTIMYRDYIFFIHSSVDAQGGWFRNLAIVKIAVIDVGVQVSLLCAV